MQVAPFVEVTVARHGRWNIALGVLAVLVVSVDAAWWWQAVRDTGAPALSTTACAALCMAAALWLCRAERRRGACALRWDGQAWVHVAAGKATVGELSACLDFGGWMLLRFVAQAEAPGAGRRTHWLPIGNSEIEAVAQWHAFRCAVYSPRPTLVTP